MSSAGSAVALTLPTDLFTFWQLPVGDMQMGSAVSGGHNHVWSADAGRIRVKCSLKLHGQSFLSLDNVPRTGGYAVARFLVCSSAGVSRADVWRLLRW